MVTLLQLIQRQEFRGPCCYLHIDPFYLLVVPFQHYLDAIRLPTQQRVT